MVRIKLQFKYILAGIAMLMLGFLLVNLQLRLTKVNADDLPLLVSTHDLDFGPSFPGEVRQGEFIVGYNDNGLVIPYRIIQKQKPLPPGHPDYPGYYKNLCPYLTKLSLEGEGDTEGASGTAMLSPDDLSDTWQVIFNVPAILGSVAQDHEGGIITEDGEYGCDIAVDIDLPECATGTLVFMIGDEEASQMDNPVDELNFQGFGIFPPFADPFDVSANSSSDFPWNSNFSQHYADDFDLNFSFYSVTSATATLELSWGPGRSGSEEKEVLLDGVSVGNTPVRVGAPVAGWWENMERFVDTFTFAITPGNHTIELKQLSGNGTIWDYVRLSITECGGIQ